MDKAYWQYWGKSLSALPPRQETYPGWHLLPYHCLDVAAVAASWWDNSQPLRQALVQACGIDAAQARAWMLLFMALHDYGKWDVRFQYKSKDTLQVIWPDFDPQWINPSLLDSKHYFHGPVGLSWFRDDYAQAMEWAKTDQPERWEDGWLPWLAAVTGHHGVIPANA
jgi:CRISPR-associated endonuclease/helicase Cas3